MGYKVVDFRELVVLWYNEFLPERIGDKSVFVEDADILYLKSIPLEPLRKDTIEFMTKKMAELSGKDIGLFVQEPKPVNNVRIQPLLKYIEGIKDMSIERRDKVLHFANRRYVPLSSNIMVSQDKEIDDFLDSVFLDLCKLDIHNVRTYQIQSLGLSDFVDSTRAFFPKKSLSIQEVSSGEYIQVRSTNEMLEQLKSCFVNGNLDGSSTAMKYVDSCKKSMDRDIEGLV
jgi:hypothetical protein